MKPVIHLALALMGCGVARAGTEFPAQTLPSIPSSLLDSARRWVGHEFAAPLATVPGVAQARTPAKFRSAMPILKPWSDIDPTFSHRPDESVDYKMIVIPPKVESTGERKR